MARLAGKVAIITGAAGGIGEASAMLFAREGAKLVLAEIDAAAGEALARRLMAAGGQAIAQATDVADPASVQAMVERAMAAYGRIDILFNNAGGTISADGPVTTIDLDAFRKTMDVNLMGPVLCCRFAIPHMIAGGGGSVINMGSIVALQGAPGSSAYPAAKGAVMALTQTMAAEWGKQKIRVNAISPGMTLTPRVRRLLDEREAFRVNQRRYLLGTVPPEEVAALALFLASDESAHLSGAVIPLDSAGRSAPSAFQ